jgi:hypothetical protein
LKLALKPILKELGTMKNCTLTELKKIFEVGNSFTYKKLCYESAYFRLQKVVSKVGGYKLEPPRKWNTPFCRIWGTLIRKDDLWLTFPLKYRARGAPGALEMRGWSRILTERDIWNGKLNPGAVLQGWKTPTDFNNARDGNRNGPTRGHSFVFLSYRYNKKKIITGMFIVDQFKVRIYRKNTWGKLFAANFPLFLGKDIGLTIRI